MSIPISPGAAQGGPRWILRLEGALLLTVALLAYDQIGQGWIVFALAFLVPDLSMLGYVAGRKVGAAAYNLAHSTLLPLALGVAGWQIAEPVLTSAALIWLAHIGFDRMLGYGLKYGTAFGHTHLGQVGQAKA